MKRKFLVILLVLVLCTVVIGFSRSWFVVTSDTDALSNKRDIHLTIDPDKVKQDAGQLKTKSTDFTGTTQ